MAQPAVSPFPADALDANRAGMLTDGQRRMLANFVRNSRGNNLVVAALVVVVGVFALTSRSFAWGGALRPVVALAAFAVAGAMVLSHLGVFSLILRDARAGRVEAIEGPIYKDMQVWQGSASTNRFYVKVAGRQFVTGRSSLQAMPDAGIVRLYYLPRSRRVVNLERLPDRVPEGVLESPEALRAAIKGSYALDTNKRAESRATLAALESLLAQRFPTAGTPPAAHERDPRPLAEAIVGSWRGGAFSLAFSPDGTATVRPPMGPEVRGRWSVDAAGRLRMDAMGGEQAGEAWVAGETLTVSFDGRTLAFQRA